MSLLDSWLLIPLPPRLVLVTCLGIVLGNLANWAIYSLAYRFRPISPWWREPEGAARRAWLDRIPLIGWWRLRREGQQFGPYFWVRPLLLELACGFGLAALYWWETDRLGLYPLLHSPEALAALAPITHPQFVAHTVLFLLLLIATFIDFDEKNIPDSITVTGTLAGLLFAGLVPSSLPPRIGVFSDGMTDVGPLLAFAGRGPSALAGGAGLALAIGIVALWSFALLDKTCTMRRGFARGCRYMIVSAVRRRTWIFVLPIGGLMSTYILAVWLYGGMGWWALLSSLLGLACGGAMIWSVRAAAGWALGIEAMGFGDVTLLAMIGTFVGWQATVVVFFLAPCTAVLVALLQWIVTRKPYIAYGPYLSLAALLLVVQWNALWTNWAADYFLLGWMILALVGVCLVLTGLMLRAWRSFRERVLHLEY